MNSLLPTGMTAANPALAASNPVASAGFPTAPAGGAGTHANTFLSFLKQSSATETDAATPTDRALKNSKGWDATLTNAANSSVAPAQDQPIPYKLSFNVFGNFRGPQQTEEDDPNTNQPAPATTQATTPAWPLQISLAPVSVPLVAAQSVPPPTAPAVKMDRSRPQKTTTAPADNPSHAQTMPAVALPVPAPLPPVPAPAEKANSAPPPSASANGIEPAAEQNRPRPTVDTDATERPAPSELAFALRLESNGQTASAPVSASIAPEQSPLLANKPVGPQPAPITAQPSQSQAGENADTSPDSGGDTARGNRHGAMDLNTEQTVAPNPGSGENSQLAAQGVYSPSAPSIPASASDPASAQATQRTPSPLPTPPADETTKTGPANQISISVPAGDQQKVEVRLMDRAGEVRVSVHAPNEELAGTLRQDLGSLTGKLNQSGYTTEAFTPSRGSGEFSRDQKNADPQQQNGSERQSSARDPQQQSSPQNGRGKRPAWLDELDNSLAT